MDRQTGDSYIPPLPKKQNLVVGSIEKNTVFFFFN